MVDNAETALNTNQLTYNELPIFMKYLNIRTISYVFSTDPGTE